MKLQKFTTGDTEKRSFRFFESSGNSVVVFCIQKKRKFHGNGVLY